MAGAWAPIQLKRAAVAAALVAGYAASVLFSFLMSRIGGQMASIWTANGFLVASFILLGGRWRIGAVGVSLLFQTVASLVVGDGLARAVLHPLVNLVEAGLAAWLAVRFCGAATRRLSLRKLALLILASIVPAAIVGGVAGAGVSLVMRGTDFIDGWLDWAIPGGLGMAIVLPALLLAAREGQYREFRRSAIETGGLIGGVCGLGMAVYFQQELPLQFAIFPALTLVAFRLGPPGAAIAGFLVAMICLTLVMLGHGPTMLATTLDHLGRIRLTEAMVTAALFTTLATACAIAEQARLRRLLIARDRAARTARQRARGAERMIGEAMLRRPSEAARKGAHFV
jgi:integral membrane sensor domain MASE1